MALPGKNTRHKPLNIKRQKAGALPSQLHEEISGFGV